MAGEEHQPGWYPDPAGRFEFRFHNGHTWTADVAVGGARYVDPLGSSPAATNGPLPDRPGSSGLAIAAMTLGIVAATIAWLPFVVMVGAVCALLAVVLGAIALARSRRLGTGNAFAVTALATGLLGGLLCVIGVVFTLAVIDAFDRYDNPAANDTRVISCELEGSTATMTGEIENLDDDVADFAVTVAFTRVGTDNARRSARADVDDVAPGEVATFELTRHVLLDDVDCLITSVTGPLPFGLDVQP